MNFEWPVFSTVLPEIILLVTALIALIVDLFVAQREKALTYGLVQAGLILSAGSLLYQFNMPDIISFNGLAIDDKLTRVLELAIHVIVIFAFIYARPYITGRGIARGEYYVLGLFSTIGMLVLVSAHSLLTIYLGMELLSLPLYAMVALKRDDVKATEAAMKYFIMGAIASGMMLYGMSMFYGATGHLDLAQIAKVISTMPSEKTLILVFGLVFILVGIGFKFAAAPFHMWAPDVYVGAPTSVTLFLGSAPKLAALAMTLRLLAITMAPLFQQWQQVLIVMAILSMGLGNLFAIAQTNLKRMLAYSAIAHIGYLLLGVISGTPEGYSASLFYVLMYAIMSVGAFGMITVLSSNGFEAENLEDFRGLNQRNPWLAGMMLIILFSMAGVPPTVGFLAKLFVIKSLVSANLVWLAAVAMGFAILGVFYYVRVVRIMYFEAPSQPEAVVCNRSVQLAISINGLLLLAFGILPGAILQACMAAIG